jgi:hypothetical protein
MAAFRPVWVTHYHPEAPVKFWGLRPILRRMTWLSITFAIPRKVWADTRLQHVKTQ